MHPNNFMGKLEHSSCSVYYGNTGCGVFKQGIQRFVPENQHTQSKVGD